MTFIDRYVSPRPRSGALGRGRRDRRRRRRPGPLRLDPGVGGGVTHLSGPARAGSGATPACGPRRSRSARPRPRRGREDARGRRGLERDARRVLRGRRAALRPPIDPGPRGSRTLERPALQGRVARRSRAIYSGWVIIAHERAPVQRDADEPQHHAVGEREGDAVPNLEILANDDAMRARCERGSGRRGRALLLMSRGIPRDEAERLIVYGFFQEVLDRIELAEIRESARRGDRGRARAARPDDGAGAGRARSPTSPWVRRGGSRRANA